MKKQIKDLSFERVTRATEHAKINGQDIRAPNYNFMFDTFEEWADIAIKRKFEDDEQKSRFCHLTAMLFIFLSKRCRQKKINLFDVFGISENIKNEIPDEDTITTTNMAKFYYDETKLNDEEREQFNALRLKCEITQGEDINLSITQYLQGDKRGEKLGGKSI